MDPDGIHHACLNIVTNAIEAVSPLSGKVEVATRLSPTSGDVWIAVVDNGPGIPPEEQPKIFQAFYSTKGQKGTGLGLAAAKKIVEEHGGRIALKTTPGQALRSSYACPGSRVRAQRTLHCLDSPVPRSLG